MDRFPVIIILFFDRQAISLRGKVLKYLRWLIKCHSYQISFTSIAKEIVAVHIRMFIWDSDMTQSYIQGNYMIVDIYIYTSMTFDCRSKERPMVKTHLGYDVLMFGFDSVSRMTFMRFLPKTYSFLIKELGAIVLKGLFYLLICYLRLIRTVYFIHRIQYSR